ncbi:arylamine N-acetyltransferase [Saccharopolyspora gloriosae]|uniref:arylamine N-acetyltransferase family protein n=1 Tax=Saccharopolyspora gloriosae TaxID=455344 RepID=UPI001FB82712|nr:arylamine N-acetyltransferase [Saccharopolyspora gloriosae]
MNTTALDAGPWSTDALDVEAYLRRIDQPRLPPSAEALRSLHEAHVRAIPFENIDVILGPHPGLELDVVADKLVDRRRGGYCFEHALLFAAALERLGYQVRRRIARVQPQRASGSETHMLLTVRVDGADFQADVGFGAGVLAPMPLRDGVVVDQAGWEHRLRREGELWVLEKRKPEGWAPLHAADERARRPVDYEVAHHYTATHPSSPFSGQPTQVLDRLSAPQPGHPRHDEVIPQGDRALRPHTREAAGAQDGS